MMLKKGWEAHKLYNGDVELFYNDAKHNYRIWDKDEQDYVIVPGCSSASKAWSDGAALTGWRINNVGDKFVEEIKGLLNSGQIITDTHLNILRKQIHQWSWGTKDKLVIGSETHDWIAAQAEGLHPPLPEHPAVRNACRAFSNWAEEVSLTPVHVERPIYSVQYGYAGRLDMEAVVNGELAIVDIKVSSGLYRDMIIQTAGYAMARNEERKYCGEGILWDRYVVRCDRDSGEAEVYHLPKDTLIQDCKVFLACLMLHRDRIAEKMASYTDLLRKQ